MTSADSAGITDYTATVSRSAQKTTVKIRGVSWNGMAKKLRKISVTQPKKRGWFIQEGRQVSLCLHCTHRLLTALYSERASLSHRPRFAIFTYRPLLWTSSVYWPAEKFTSASLIDIATASAFYSVTRTPLFFPFFPDPHHYVTPFSIHDFYDDDWQWSVAKTEQSQSDGAIEDNQFWGERKRKYEKLGHGVKKTVGARDPTPKTWWKMRRKQNLNSAKSDEIRRENQNQTSDFFLSFSSRNNFHFSTGGIRNIK